MHVVNAYLLGYVTEILQANTIDECVNFKSLL